MNQMNDLITVRLHKHAVTALSTAILGLVAVMVMLTGCNTAAAPDTSPSFGSHTIPAALQDAALPVRFAIPRISLPEASGGDGDLTYSLTHVPGLSFDPGSRVVSGMPTTVGPYPLTYKATDKDGDAATLTVNITVTHSKIFWTDYDKGSIWSANLDGSDAKSLLMTDSRAEPHGIALDVPGNKMYWVELVSGAIRRANLDGTGVEDLATEETSTPRGIALDLSGGKMYWTGNQPIRIQRANLDGTGIENLVTTEDGLEYPTAIALDIVNGKMYWADAGNSMIRRADLDGSDIEELVEQLNDPYGVALDVTGGKLYWTNRRSGDIQRADLDGSNVELLVNVPSAPAQINLDLIGRKMYWAAQDTQKIQRADLDGSNVEDVVADTMAMEEPQNIALH